MAISLPNFPPFKVHLDGNAGPRWKKWLGRFERLTIAMGITDDKQKKLFAALRRSRGRRDLRDTSRRRRGQGLQQSRRKTNRLLLSTSEHNIRRIQLPSGQAKGWRNPGQFPYPSEKPSKDLRFRKSRQRLKNKSS